MNDILLNAKDLYFSYDEGNTMSLNGLSLTISRGKKIACMGANGSGKSTFFLCCNGILRPDKGSLYYEGAPYQYTKKSLLDLRSKVGIVFQNPDRQLFSASVRQEISFGILNMDVSEETAAKEVDAIMERMEITPFSQKPTHALSGGQKKQVAIADILVMHPEIIILDEPESALDPKHTALIHKLIDELTDDGTTVLVATHNVDFALSWADEIILFKDGQVLAQDTPGVVLENEMLLAQTNLEVPAALKLFNRLCKKGILSTSLMPPKNLTELESYIAEIGKD